MTKNWDGDILATKSGIKTTGLSRAFQMDFGFLELCGWSPNSTDCWVGSGTMVWWLRLGLRLGLGLGLRLGLGLGLGLGWYWWYWWVVVLASKCESALIEEAAVFAGSDSAKAYLSNHYTATTLYNTNTIFIQPLYYFFATLLHYTIPIPYLCLPLSL